ncbi:MAG TPA: FixH family protein [Pseudolabrys sp.]|nr:FixH family protein [Pseudolabrys sp.]
MNPFSRSDKKPRELTGRAVLIWLIGFFGLVFVVNGFMADAAIRTFAGVDAESSYKAGQMFEHEVALAKAQDALHWTVDGNINLDRVGEAVLDMTVRDAHGQPVGGLRADARLWHPADSRRDHVIRLAQTGPGAFHGEARAHSGKWELVIDFYRGDTRMFRSRSEIVLK